MLRFSRLEGTLAVGLAFIVALGAGFQGWQGWAASRPAAIEIQGPRGGEDRVAPAAMAAVSPSSTQVEMVAHDRPEQTHPGVPHHLFGLHPAVAAAAGQSAGSPDEPAADPNQSAADTDQAAGDPDQAVGDNPPNHAVTDCDPVAPPPATTGLLNINTATAGQLTELPGIGPVLAERIVAYREAWGPFAAPADLMEVSGIGPRRFEDLAHLVVAD